MGPFFLCYSQVNGAKVIRCDDNSNNVIVVWATRCIVGPPAMVVSPSGSLLAIVDNEPGVLADNTACRPSSITLLLYSSTAIILSAIINGLAVGRRYIYYPDMWGLLLRYHVCISTATAVPTTNHDYVIKWKHFPRDRPFVRGIQRPPVNSLAIALIVTSL